MELIPYREWVQIDDPAVAIHGPFNFATLNNRKTRDRISEADWLVLQNRKQYYQDQAPSLAPRIMSMDISQPTYKKVVGNKEDQRRCEAFMFNMEFNDRDLKCFGAEQF